MPKTGANIEYTTPLPYVLAGLDAGIKHIRWHITGDTTNGQDQYRASLMFLANELRLKMAHIHPRADVTIALMGAPPVLGTLPDIWSEIGSMFLGTPGVFGLDILNEPNISVAEWTSLANATIRAIKNVGRYRCIVQTRRGEPGRLRELKDIKADMLSVHFYSQMSWSHQGLYSYPAPCSLDISPVRRSLDSLEVAHDEMRKPLYVGEFSGVVGAPGANRWLKEVIARCDRNGWHSAYHAWCSGAPWTAEHPDRLELLEQYWARG